MKTPECSAQDLAHNGGGPGIVPLVIRPGSLKACHCIAVDASKQARIIHSDVLADGTKAVLTLARVLFNLQIQSEKSGDEFIIHALSGLYAVLLQVEFISTAPDLHPAHRGMFREGSHQRSKGLLTTRQEFNALFRQVADALLELAVQVSHAHH
jgi:hypothetical protein